jgi:DNA-directed RNA polymerase subunit M/transcription elongation factor TFIIS
MDRAAAVPGPFAGGAVKQECLECGAATIVVQSRATGYGRYRRFECKKCQHRFNIILWRAKR